MSRALRAATPADVPAITATVEAAFALYVPRLGRRPSPMDDDHAAWVARHVVVLAEEAGELLGLSVLVGHPDHLEVDVLAVAPGRQGRGVGRELLADAERRARERGTPELRLLTNAVMTENLALYPRLGFVETERRTERGFSRVFSSKRL